MPTDNRGYFTADFPFTNKATESEAVQASAETAVQNAAPSPAPVAVTHAQVAAVAAQPVSHPALDKLFLILSALEPLLLAGAAPFIKNPNTQAIIQEEAPIAQALSQALSGL